MSQQSVAVEVLEREEEHSLQCQQRAMEVRKTAPAVQGQSNRGAERPSEASIEVLSVVVQMHRQTLAVDTTI